MNSDNPHPNIPENILSASDTFVRPNGVVMYESDEDENDLGVERIRHNGYRDYNLFHGNHNGERHSRNSHLHHRSS